MGWELEGWRDPAKKKKKKELMHVDNSMVIAGGRSGVGVGGIGYKGDKR